jgi:hypothetical protein
MDVRAGHRARGRTVRRLRIGYLRGELSEDTFEGRVAVAYTAVGAADLQALQADLPTPLDRARLVLGSLVRAAWPAPMALPALELPAVAGGTTVLVGRSSGCALRIAEPSVSRVHAELRRTGAGWLLVDCGSANGTYVNGCRVHRAVVAAGDRVAFGAATVILRG